MPSRNSKSRLIHGPTGSIFATPDQVNHPFEPLGFETVIPDGIPPVVVYCMFCKKHLPNGTTVIWYQWPGSESDPATMSTHFAHPVGGCDDR